MDEVNEIECSTKDVKPGESVKTVGKLSKTCCNCYCCETESEIG